MEEIAYHAQTEEPVDIFSELLLSRRRLGH